MRDTLLARRFESATLLINTIPLANIGDNHKARTATPVNVRIDRAVERDGGQTVRCASAESRFVRSQLWNIEARVA